MIHIKVPVLVVGEVDGIQALIGEVVQVIGEIVFEVEVDRQMAEVGETNTILCTY